MNELPLLSLLVALPWLGALLLWLWPKAPVRGLAFVFLCLDARARGDRGRGL
jgi:hypothetical protein